MGLQLEVDPIIHGLTNALLAAEITRSRLDGASAIDCW
jgi:hypothetical protein